MPTFMLCDEFLGHPTDPLAPLGLRHWEPGFAIYDSFCVGIEAGFLPDGAEAKFEVLPGSAAFVAEPGAAFAARREKFV
jgi:hypothetical protein